MVDLLIDTIEAMIKRCRDDGEKHLQEGAAYEKAIRQLIVINYLDGYSSLVTEWLLAGKIEWLDLIRWNQFRATIWQDD